MRKSVWLTVAILVALLGASVVFAQAPIIMVTAKIPFEFYAGKTRLPAGSYEVYQPDDTALDLVIQNTETGRAIVVSVLTRVVANNSSKAELVFKKVGDHTDLSEVFPTTSDGYQLSDVREARTASAKSLPRNAVPGD